MITTVHSLAVLLARDLGLATLDSSENLSNQIARPVTTADKMAIITAINGAYLELFKDAPATISETEKGDVLRASTTITLAATQYSTTISSVVTYASWMKGCTIRIGGDEFDNELINATTLARPYTGSTGSVSATVYADCIPLSGVSHVMPPVRILGFASMRMVDTREAFIDSIGNARRRGGESSGDYDGQAYGTDINKTSGEPTTAFVDTRFSETETGLQKFLRFNRIPDRVMSVNYRAKLLPPTYTLDDLGDDIDVDEAATSMPLDGLSSILYAIARKRISGDPLFGAPNAIPEIDRQYRHAIASLGSSQVSLAPKDGHYF